MKSAIPYPLIAMHSWYYMSNSLNSIAHNDTCPAASGLLIALRRGLYIKTITVCAWKYSLSFRATVTNAKASFSIGGYFTSAPCNIWLVKYTSLCTPFSFLTKAALIVAGETARYRNNSSPGFDELSNGGEERYAFRSSNAC